MESKDQKNADIFTAIENITSCEKLSEMQQSTINDILEDGEDSWDAATAICDMLEIGYRGNRRPIALMLDRQTPKECTE